VMSRLSRRKSYTNMHCDGSLSRRDGHHPLFVNFSSSGARLILSISFAPGDRIAGGDPSALQRQPKVRRHGEQLLAAQCTVRCDGSLASDHWRASMRPLGAARQALTWALFRICGTRIRCWPEDQLNISGKAQQPSQEPLGRESLDRP
jgi:hypothetical protein